MNSKQVNENEVADAVETPEEKIELPVKLADKFRAMKVGDHLIIPDEYNRGAYLSGAKRAVPDGKFTTHKKAETIYLFRTQ